MWVDHSLAKGRLCALMVPLLLTACGGEPEAEAEPDLVRPVKTIVIGDASAAGTRNFPARIAAAQRADVAFRVPGTVQELAFQQGDRVEKGDTVARLDPKDYQIVVNDRTATLENAKANWDRAQDLIKQGYISKMDYDRLQAEFRIATAALETAQQDLTYTELPAPFAGMVALRHVEQFEEVQAKEPVYTLQNVGALEVRFDVPESIIRGIRGDTEAGERSSRVDVNASFVDLPGKTFPLTFKEIATRADASTQTFEATYVMDQVEDATILPGMTANVVVDFSRAVDEGMMYTVPVTSVVGDYKLDPRVWIVDEESMTVSPKPVKIGRLLRGSAEVLEGLQPGERIVTAGTPFLVEGMQVLLMPEIEQAEPRPEDLKFQ
jgi:RND family efflux transporter MFP subunit